LGIEERLSLLNKQIINKNLAGGNTPGGFLSVTGIYDLLLRGNIRPMVAGPVPLRLGIALKPEFL
jgi:hypothetical protein